MVQLDDKEEPEMVEYEVKRVDFGELLPLETLREVSPLAFRLSSSKLTRSSYRSSATSTRPRCTSCQA